MPVISGFLLIDVDAGFIMWYIRSGVKTDD